MHRSREAAEAASRASRAKRIKTEADERNILLPFRDVIEEVFERETLDRFLLYRATIDPLSIAEWLLVRERPEGLVRYVRDQLFPVVPEQKFAQWVAILRDGQRPEDMFWSFVACINADDSVRDMVCRTWHGSARALECIMEYYDCRYVELLESPFDPLNGRMLLRGMWRIVRYDVLPMNMTRILMQGRLKPMLVPLSRNAHRARKQQLREELTTNLPPV